VFAEMGSINPVFLLPSALSERADAIARSLAQSITAGVGQFCTNPGVVLGLRGETFDRFGAELSALLDGAEADVMLHEGIANAYASAVEQARASGVTPLTARTRDPAINRATPALLTTDADRFASDARLREEMFGPVSVLVTAEDMDGLERAAEALEGQLTATVHGTPDDLRSHGKLIEILERKVGRIVFNGVPTGVEVGHAMHHGGPYPASSDSRTTSVGTAAISRFARPVCYQDFPDVALPAELRDRNERGIWRLVNGSPSQQDIEAAAPPA
jgi:NADP-dependent aldehyde dehydrogenase